MSYLPVRLSPGDDLRRALEREAAAALAGSAFVVAGIGSLSGASLVARKERIPTPCWSEPVTSCFNLVGSGVHFHVKSSALRAGGTRKKMPVSG